MWLVVPPVPDLTRGRAREWGHPAAIACDGDVSNQTREWNEQVQRGRDVDLLACGSAKRRAEAV